MITNKITTAALGKDRGLSFQRAGLETDAAAWANLLDEWIGPESDVYAKLPKDAGSKKQSAKLSA